MWWAYEMNYFNMVPIINIVMVFGAVIHSVSSVEAVSDCHQSERQALLSFKHDLTDPSDRLSSWVAGGGISCCNWHGVVCGNMTGHVLELHLRGLRVGGQLSSSLLDLKYLRYLDLGNNDFGGIRIPPFVGAMQSLTYLNLADAGFGGEIPSRLGNLSNLLSLAITGFNEYGIRTKNLGWLSGLSKLRYLDLSRVILPKSLDALQGINALHLLEELHLPECGLDHISHFPYLNFSNLVTLDLSYNRFGSFPGGLENITSLKYLDLSWCYIYSTFPNWLYKFSQLEKLVLPGNTLQGTIADDIANLTFLNHLNLSENSLKGKMSMSLRTMCKLEWIDLSRFRIGEKVSEVLSSLAGCASNRLHYISFSGCELRGSLSTFEIGQFQNLEQLDLSQNVISGSIPDSLGSLNSLLRLNISSNQLNGALPYAFRQLHRLEDLHLGNNSISGPIPRSIGFLISLLRLELSTNKLNGTLPQTICKLHGLRFLNLQKNLLSGAIPECLGSLSSLTSLVLSGNKLSGILPASLGQLIQLETLDVGFNSLEGLLSPVLFFANLTSLKYLLASGNRIRMQVSPDWIPPSQLVVVHLSSWYLGPKFPKWISSLDNLLALEISDAGINDTLPGWFGNMTSHISSVNLSHNHFQGKISSIAGPLSRLSSNVVILDLSNNSFSGPISSLLCAGEKELNSLEFLHLGNNYLFGEIPDCWSNWPSLLSIELLNNNLTGSLPNSLGSLKLLKYLHLRNNLLSGVLPSSLQNCTELLIFDTAKNKLSGILPKWIGQRLSNVRILNLGANNFDGHVPNEFCALSLLSILDMTHNNLSGAIPDCLANFSAMAELSDSDFTSLIPLNSYTADSTYEENAIVVTKSLVLEYTMNLQFMTAIDLSNNRLSGPIPEAITNLVALKSLNLSGNYLTGKIPKNIGNMSALESLELSWNKLSGEIPQSMASMTFLSFLNLSFNDLVGRIPTSTQIQSFDSSSFIGNKLCGLPVSANCGPDGSAQSKQQGDDKHHGLEYDELYMSMSLGFVVGFGALVAPLLYITSWRQQYFQWVQSVMDRLWVWTVILFRTSWCRR